MFETFIQWFLNWTAIKLIYEMYTSKTQRRWFKDQASDLLAVVAVDVAAAKLHIKCLLDRCLSIVVTVMNAKSKLAPRMC